MTRRIWPEYNLAASDFQKRYGSVSGGQPLEMADHGVEDYRVELTPDLDSVHAARDFVAQHAYSLPQWCRDDLELLVSELVTNAIRHGQPAISLVMHVDPPLVGVEVRDQGPSVPASVPPEAPLDGAGGRGLLIVDRIASSWGVVPADLPPGKTVWFQLGEAPTGEPEDA